MKPEKLNEEELEMAKADLREWMPKGSTVYTILRSVSRSGMMRVISPVMLQTKKVLRPDCASAFHYVAEPIFPDYKVAQVLGLSLDKSEGVKISGAGMDMGFHLVYSLASVLYGDGYALKQRWL